MTSLTHLWLMWPYVTCVWPVCVSDEHSVGVMYEGLRVPSCPPLICNVLPVRPESVSDELSQSQSEFPSEQLAGVCSQAAPVEDQLEQVVLSAAKVRVSGLCSVLSANCPTEFTVDARQARPAQPLHVFITVCQTFFVLFLCCYSSLVICHLCLCVVNL